MGGFYNNQANAESAPLTGNETFVAETGGVGGAAPVTVSVTPMALHTYAVPVSTLAYAATITPDVSTSSAFTTTLTGNAVLANPANLTSGRVWRVEVKQDATGSRTLTYGNLYKWVGRTAPTLSTTANYIDVLSFFYDGNIIVGSAQLNIG
jgi:hypothetical protein